MNFMNQCITSKEIIIRPTDKPWHDSQIRRISRQRDRLKSIATKSERLTDWNKYKKMRNKVNNLKKYAKQRYYNNLDKRLSSARFENPKQYWKYLRSLVSNNTTNSIPIFRTVDNGLEMFHYTDKDKGNCLNEHLLQYQN